MSLVRRLRGPVQPGPPGNAGWGAPDPWAARRNRMVDQGAGFRQVGHAGVLAALRRVPRHRFVPAELQAEAYADHPLPIGHGQTISQPSLVAFMIGLLEASPASRALEIGTGSGYQTALLAEVCAEVFSIERIPALADRAAARLNELGYRSIRLRTGDGWDGWPEEAPFDAIIVSAATPVIPPPLLLQLADGGHMVVPVGPALGSQDLVLVTRQGNETHSRAVLAVQFVPFVTAGDRPRTRLSPS